MGLSLRVPFVLATMITLSSSSFDTGLTNVHPTPATEAQSVIVAVVLIALSTIVVRPKVLALVAHTFATGSTVVEHLSITFVIQCTVLFAPQVIQASEKFSATIACNAISIRNVLQFDLEFYYYGPAHRTASTVSVCSAGENGVFT